MFHDYGTNVRELKVWTGGEHNGFRAIYVKLFNGKEFTAGSIPAYGASSITFAQGETIIGTIELCGNGIGTRTGHIHFKTSLGQDFRVGDEHTPYYFDSGNSFLTGVFGMAGGEIMHLGFYMMKPIRGSRLQNVNYPTLDNYFVGLTPKVHSADLCNDDPLTSQKQTSEFVKSVGTKFHWSVSSSFKIGESISVTAGIPEIGSAKAEMHWELGLTASYEQEKNTVTTETQTYPVTVPPNSRVRATFSWWDSVCDVPYTADLHFDYTDGSSFNFALNDQYNGAYISDVKGDFHTERLKDGEKCGGHTFVASA